MRQTTFRQGRTTRWAVAWTLALPPPAESAPQTVTGPHVIGSNTRRLARAPPTQTPPAKRIKTETNRPLPRTYKFMVDNWISSSTSLLERVRNTLSKCAVIVDPSRVSPFQLTGRITTQSTALSDTTLWHEFSREHPETVPALPVAVEVTILQVGSRGAARNQYQVTIALSRSQTPPQSPLSEGDTMIARATVLAFLHTSLTDALSQQ